MKIQSISPLVNFMGEPKNFARIDKVVSRSAQPTPEDFAWLKEQGITDVINFRTLYVPGVDFKEEEVVKELGMNYHNIPTITFKPNENKIKSFLALVEKIATNGGKAHIHCMAGADRTGMYAFVYKAIKGIGTIAENEKEWIERGHNITKYPDLRNWTKNFVKTLKK
ncbi:MAG: hypothetical protein E7Z92_06100 [Cyanobacteria bacterium SIG31]|nr:hypothetical protein [Cyanobacteria bacterium SIG31]